MLKHWFILLGVLLSFISYSQTLTVLDDNNGDPLEYVSLYSENPYAYASTNAQGEVNIDAFRNASHIQVRLFGYENISLNFSELEQSGFIIRLKPSNVQIDQVTVAGTRWRQNSNSLPIKVIAITPKEIALQNPQTMADLLGISGKVYIQKSQQGGGSPMIRGFATNRLLYSVDGVRMNNAIFRGGNIQNVISLDPFCMQNTEVLFGPGSVLYGSDAIGGVMSFQTLSPQLSIHDEALITGKAIHRYSSANNELTYHMDVNVGWKKWALVTSISSFDYGDLKQGSKGPNDYIKDYYVQRIDSIDRIVKQSDPLLQIPTAYSQLNLMQKLRYKANENWDFQYAFHMSETSPYGRYDRHNRLRNDLPRYAVWDYGPQKWMMNHFRIEHEGKGKWYDDLTMVAAAQNFEESRNERSFNSEELSTQTEKVKALSLNIDFLKTISSRHSINYGVELVNNQVESYGVLENISDHSFKTGPARYPEASWNSLGAYLNDIYKVSGDLSIQSGLRYNQYTVKGTFDTTFYPLPFTKTELSNGALTGSIGIAYHPGKSLSLSLNGGTAFRSPNVDDLGKVFDSEPGAVTVPNPDLRSEYAYNIDAGIAKRFGNYMKIDLSAFYTILNNAMVRRDFQLNGIDSIIYSGELSKVQAVQNAAQARVYGVQAGLELKLKSGFSFSTDLNYQKGVEELDNGNKSPSRHAAPFFGVSRLNYSKSRLSMQWYMQFQAQVNYENLAEEERTKTEIYAKDANGNNYSPSWYTLNFKVLYHFTSHFSISSGIENITDIRYRPYSSGLSAPGRNFILTAKATF